MQPPDPQRDFVAFSRMVDALTTTERISADQARHLKSQAGEFVAQLQVSATLPESDRDDSAGEVNLDVLPLADQTIESVSQRLPSIVHPSPPRRGFADVLAGFLEQHNIRWGELIAGMLIVLCSIGLVLSLWNTLTAAHRIVPAVVFMSADAAIFAAGLYTMRRWKLRHTSRAVLIIATLLVPLCVLAGLAAAGASAASVELTDPVTLGVIVIATAGVGWLLWQATLGLVGRTGAASLALSVMASSLTLPILPAASRWLGTNAGWIVLLPSLVTAVALVARHRTRDPRGRRGWKNHWLHLGISVSSLASVIVYAAFLFRDDGAAAWIRIAIASIPCWVAIAMVEGSHVAEKLKHPTKDAATRRLIASVIASLAIGAIAAILPASFAKLPWLWTHAIVVTTSAILFSVQRKRFDQVLLSVMPLGLVAMVTSPVWLTSLWTTGTPWAEVDLVGSVLTGEPLLVATTMLLVGIGLRTLAGFKDFGTTRWIRGWTYLATGIFGIGTLWRCASVVVAPITMEIAIPNSFRSLPIASNSSIILHAVSMVGMAIACYATRREPISPSVPTMRLGSMCLGSMRLGFGSIGVLFVAVVVATRWSDLFDHRLVVLVTLAAVGWAVVAWRLRSRSLAVAAAASVGVGSLMLIGTSWWPSVLEQVPPAPFIAGTLAVWWIGSAITLSYFRGDRNQILSAVLLALTAAMITPALGWLSPIVWFQASGIGEVVWLACQAIGSRWGGRVSAAMIVNHPSEDAGENVSLAWVQIVGLASAALVLIGIVNQASWTVWWSLPLGGLMTALALGLVPATSIKNRLGWRSLMPLILPIMSGHLACYAVILGWVDQVDIWMVVVGCGLIGCLGSAVVVWANRSLIHAWHVTVQTAVLMVSALALSGDAQSLGLFGGMGNVPSWFTIVAILGLVVGATALMRFPSRWLARGLGWLVIFGGGYLVGIQWNGNGFDARSLTSMMAWVGGLVILWRSDLWLGHRPTRGSRADEEASALLILMLGITGAIILLGPEWRVATADGNAVIQSALQCLVALIAGASIWIYRDDVSDATELNTTGLNTAGPSVTGPSMTGLSMTGPSAFGSQSRWRASVWLMVGSLSLACTLVATVWGVSVGTRWLVLSLSAASVLVASVGCLPRRGHLAAASAIDRVTMGCAVMGSLIAIGLSQVTWEFDTRLSVLGIGMLAWAMFSLSEQTQPKDGTIAQRRRHRCVGIGLWAVALISVLGSSQMFSAGASEQALSGPGLPLLVATMRLLIACGLVIATMLLVIPKLLAGPFVARWQSALRRGGKMAGVTAVGSLATMLVLEWTLRERDLGIAGVPLSLVVVVAIMLGALSLMAGVIAVLTGPGFGGDGKPNWLRLEDRQRTGLVYLAQAFGGLTWLHYYLCRGSMAYLGLRQVWPYVVMAIAFASVGLAQWALRRRDTVLADTMKRTAMFLPLIPVVGFWLSGAYAMVLQDIGWSWTFSRGTTSYQALLIVGAIYYGVMSFLWRSGFPRVASVILANAGLWVILIQTPGWGFLLHPQAWLIPPAACVLLIAHWQRDSLEPALGSAVRYAATLTIYLSSTADLLLSEIGTSLWGPIVLIGLSMVGMLAGVALRVKPFLYLGTVFTFLGIMSMVWRAGQAIDAVWPWWVFGITTGLILLSILAGIEKHKDRLTQWSQRLATWS